MKTVIKICFLDILIQFQEVTSNAMKLYMKVQEGLDLDILQSFNQLDGSQMVVCRMDRETIIFTIAHTSGQMLRSISGMILI